MICCDRCITVFSFNGKGYDRLFFEGVSIFGSDGIEPTDSGFKQNAEYRIRIPSDEEILVKCGDRVALGNADFLDYENAYTVMKVKDNRRGNLKHYLLMIK